MIQTGEAFLALVPLVGKGRQHNNEVPKFCFSISLSLPADNGSGRTVSSFMRIILPGIGSCFYIKKLAVECGVKICYAIPQREWQFDYDRVMEGEKYYAIV